MKRKEIINKYSTSVNMTYKQLLDWSKNPNSYLASLDRRPIKRNLKLLKRNPKDWETEDYLSANKTISFIARMKKVSRGGIRIKIGKQTYSKRDIALKNWGFDPFK